MPIRYEVEPAARLVVLTVEGPARVSEFAGVLGQLTRDPAFAPTFGRLWDLRRVTEGLTQEEFGRLVQAYRAVAPGLAGGRAAFVAEADAHFGIARMFSALVDTLGIEFATFRDMDEARTWLGRDA